MMLTVKLDTKQLNVHKFGAENNKLTMFGGQWDCVKC